MDLKLVLAVCCLFVVLPYTNAGCRNNAAANYVCSCKVVYDCCGHPSSAGVITTDVNSFNLLGDKPSPFFNHPNIKISGKKQRKRKQDSQFRDDCKHQCFGYAVNYFGLTGTSFDVAGNIFINDVTQRGIICKAMLNDFGITAMTESCNLYLEYGRKCDGNQLPRYYIGSVTGCTEVKLESRKVYQSTDHTAIYGTTDITFTIEQ